MVFPDFRNELKINGSWVDVTSYSYTRDSARITRGRPDEWSQAVPPPSMLACTLDNRSGRFSPRNPTGPYFGLLGRNQPIRNSVPGDGTVACRLPGRYGTDNVTTPDNAALHITGDIDIRVDVTLDNPLQYQTLAVRGDWGNGSNAVNLGWIFYLGGAGQLRFAWSASGTADSAPSGAVPSTANLTASQTGTRIALRVTMDVDNGAGSKVITFYTAPTISGSWTQLGNAVTVSGTTSIFASTAATQLGEAGSNARTANSSIAAGKLHAFQLLNGIAGSAVANPDFTAQAVGTTSFTDAAGRVWTLNGDCEITDRRYRFHGETSELPPRWDTSGNDVYVPLTASGILRRLGQGSTPVTSPLKRAITSSSTTPIAYWPAEDASTATSIASASNAAAMTVTGGPPSYASDTHIGGSAALPSLQGSTWTGTIPAYTKPSPDSFQFFFAVYLPSAPANNAVVARAVAGSTRFDLCYTTASSGGLYVNCYDLTTGTLVGTDNTGIARVGTVSTGTVYTVGIVATQTVTGSNFWVQADLFQSAISGSAGGDLVTGRTLGTLSQVSINPAGTLTDTVAGHITVYNQTTTVSTTTNYNPPMFPPPQASAASGNAGETAGNRFVRLCLEQGIQPRTVGNPADSPAMGGQGSDTLLNLLAACAAVDGGLLYEPRDVLGIGMRMRSSLFDETSSVTLSHSGGQLSPPLEPTDDDALTRNDWTVTNSTTGNSVRATLDAGTMSTADPPAGVGRYADTLIGNLKDDTLLDDLATWLVHVGTVNEQRFPSITVQLENTNAFGAASGATSQAIQALDIGQVITLTGMPAWMPPDDSRQLIEGTTEILTAKSWYITHNCAPASPYDILIWDDATYGRWDSDASTLHDATLTSGATSMQVDTAGTSPLWTTSAGDFPFDITMAGERITVTNITGSSSPQTFTITRAVNGVAKAHVAGETVSLFRPFYWAPY